jgi:hypothetical protein
MNRHSIFGICAATVLGAALLAENSAAQQKTLKQQLVGIWSFVRTEATQQDGSKILPFGQNPKGVNIFTEDGHFAQIQIADGIPKFASNSRVTGTAEENKAAVVGRWSRARFRTGSALSKFDRSTP